MTENNALEQLKAFLDKGEKVESIVFGAWGWGSAPDEGKEWDPGYGEPEPTPVPFEQRGKILSWKRARPYLKLFSFNGGFGAPSTYAVRIWTNRRVIWVTQYDGSTGLDSALRNPEAHFPSMPGG